MFAVVIWERQNRAWTEAVAGGVEGGKDGLERLRMEIWLMINLIWREKHVCPD